MFDVFFISYNEPNADANWQLLKNKCPTAKRVTGITGIHQAHIVAAKQSFTNMFYVVDGDAVINDNFNFNYQVPNLERTHVHVWRSINPVNNLIYGYGGIKLLPKKETISMDVTRPDMTTSISQHFNVMPEISNITEFNTDPFNTWKSAFRECVKLSSKSIDRQDNHETNERLHTWKTVGAEMPFGNYAIEGAVAGEKYGLQNKNNIEQIKKINDFKWLSLTFKNLYE
jgi:hypothetical protein